LNFEPFDTIAQVAAAFAGFVGVILAIRSRGGALPRLQMAGFLQTSLGAVAFALLPQFFTEVLTNEKTAWQLLCGLFGVFHLLVFINYLAKHKDLRKMDWLQKSISIASVPVIGLKLAAGAGFLLDHAFAIYHLGLLWLVGVSIFFFSQILLDEGHA
jgi:hypothetical protein